MQFYQHEADVIRMALLGEQQEIIEAVRRHVGQGTLIQWEDVLGLAENGRVASELLDLFVGERWDRIEPGSGLARRLAGILVAARDRVAEEVAFELEAGRWPEIAPLSARVMALDALSKRAALPDEPPRAPETACLHPELSMDSPSNVDLDGDGLSGVVYCRACRTKGIFAIAGSQIEWEDA